MPRPYASDLTARGVLRGTTFIRYPQLRGLGQVLNQVPAQVFISDYGTPWDESQASIATTTPTTIGGTYGGTAALQSFIDATQRSMHPSLQQYGIQQPGTTTTPPSPMGKYGALIAVAALAVFLAMGARKI